MNAARLLTVAIPTIGSSRYLPETIKSAVRELPPDSEIILSDNASPDPGALRDLGSTDPRIRLIVQDARLPMAESWNACLRESRGRFFLLLSDDDLLGQGSLRAMCEVLGTNDRAGFCAVRTRLVDPRGRTFWVSPKHPDRESAADCAMAYLGRRRVFYPCSMMFRSAELRAAGGFDQAFGPAADVAAWILCSHRAGQAAFSEKSYCSYREHPLSMTAATAISDWRDHIDAIGRLLEHLYGPETGAAALAGKLGNYMAMDFAAKAAVSAGAGPLQAMREAAAYATSDYAAFARISAKLSYNWLRRKAFSPLKSGQLR
jgi:glycosyltransferase involved in cell wall biosynthesis